MYEKLNKYEIDLQLCKVPQCMKFFIEIGCLVLLKLRNLKFKNPGDCVFYIQLKIVCATLMLKSNFDLMDGKFISSVALLFNISENLLESKPFTTSRKPPCFEKKSTLCMLN